MEVNSTQNILNYSIELSDPLNPIIIEDIKYFPINEVLNLVVEQLLIEGEVQDLEDYNISIAITDPDGEVFINNSQLMKLGLYSCAQDALMNYAINDVADHIANKYTHMQLGTSGDVTNPYAKLDLVAPVFDRAAVSTTLIDTYSTSTGYPDTVQFVAIIPCTSGQTIQEVGLFPSSTGGIMGARQVITSYPVVNSDNVGVIWKVVCGRV